MNEPLKLYISEKLSQNFASKISKINKQGTRLLGTVEYKSRVCMEKNRIKHQSISITGGPEPRQFEFSWKNTYKTCKCIFLTQSYYEGLAVGPQVNSAFCQSP